MWPDLIDDWRRRYGTRSSNSKRTNEDSDEASSTPSQTKRPRPVGSNASSSTPVEPSHGPPPSQDYEFDTIKVEPRSKPPVPIVDLTENEPTPPATGPTPSLDPEPAPSVSGTPAPSKAAKSLLTALSRAQSAQFNVFRLRQYYYQVCGSYTLVCPSIAAKFPAIADQLRLEVFLHPTGTVEDGIVEAYLDLGIFKGTMILGTSKEHLAKWCFMQHQQHWTQHHTHNDNDQEFQRLRTAYFAAWEYSGSAKAGDGSCIFPPIDTKPDNAPSFTCEYRVFDTYRLFLKPGPIFADNGLIEFSDLTGLQFSGTLNFPMLSDEPIAINGFKIDGNTTAKPQAWSSYVTPNIQYGAAWKNDHEQSAAGQEMDAPEGLARIQ